MIFYRLFRYFAFLFCVGCIFLYLSRNSFSPYPALSQAFQNFDTYYQSLDSTSNAGGDAEKVEGILRSEVERFIQPENNTLDRFLADEETKASLNTFDRGFESLEALVRKYFVSDETFKDLVITRQGAILYRYENVPINQTFGISKNISAESGILTIKALHSSESFLARVMRSEYPIVFKWENNNTYSQTLPSRTFDRSILKMETELLPSGFEIIQQKDREILYLYKPAEPYIPGPVFYFIETLPKPQFFSYKALFITFFLIALLLIFILDRQIIRFLRTRSQKQARKNLFPAFNREPESEDSAEWLDKLAANEFSEHHKAKGEEEIQPPPQENTEPKIEKELLSPPNKEGGRDV